MSRTLVQSPRDKYKVLGIRQDIANAGTMWVGNHVFDLSLRAHADNRVASVSDAKTLFCCLIQLVRLVAVQNRNVAPDLAPVVVVSVAG